MVQPRAAGATARRAPRAARAVGLVIALGAVVGACSGDDAGPEIRKEDPVGVGEEAIGTCLLFEDAVGAEVAELPVIDCAEPHSHEIYALTSSTEPVYPGFDVLEQQALRYCLAEFEPYVGRSPFDSELFYSWMVPTLDGWNDDSRMDREIVCVLGHGTAQPLTNSMRGADR